MCPGKAGPRRDDDPATVDYLREQAPYSQHNGYSLRRDLYSFDNTLQEGNRMTICSWRTQSMNFVRSHDKLRNSKARCATTSILQNPAFGGSARVWNVRSILRNDFGCVAQIHPASCVAISGCSLRRRFSFSRSQVVSPMTASGCSRGSRTTFAIRVCFQPLYSLA